MPPSFEAATNQPFALIRTTPGLSNYVTSRKRQTELPGRVLHPAPSSASIVVLLKRHVNESGERVCVPDGPELIE